MTPKTMQKTKNLGSIEGVKMSDLRKPLSGIQCGEVAGSATAAQFPSIACSMVMINAEQSNAGNVYIGGAGVTKPNGTTDTTTGLELAPGQSSGWLPIDNLNRLYRICDNAGDDVTYLALS
jgi:hypothetical protein